MKLTFLAAAFALAAGLPARADDGATEAARAALTEKADVPAAMPVLPSRAADRARVVQEGVVHGKQGEATREAHGAAVEHGRSAAANAETANRSAQGAAAKAANAAKASAKAAAGQARAAEAREKHKKKPPKPKPPRGP